MDLERDLPIETPFGPFDWVFHMAGLAHVVPRNEAQRQLFHTVNVEGTLRLLAALERAPRLPESFVLASSVAVYGAEKGERLDETTPCNASDAYGRSKIEAEKAVLAWGARTGVRVGIVRLPLVVGANPPGNLGRMVRAIERGRYLRIGRGAARRSVVLATDVAEVLPRLAAQGGTYNLTDGHHPSFAELEEAIARALNARRPLGISQTVASALARLGDLIGALGAPAPFDSQSLKKMTSTLTFDDARARSELQWNPRPAVDGLATILTDRAS